MDDPGSLSFGCLALDAHLQQPVIGEPQDAPAEEDLPWFALAGDRLFRLLWRGCAVDVEGHQHPGEQHSRWTDAGVAVDHHPLLGLLLLLQPCGVEGAVLPVRGKERHDAEVGLELQAIVFEQQLPSDGASEAVVVELIGGEGVGHGAVVNRSGLR